MDEKGQHKGGNGFWLGVVVGGLLVFLLTTKKGRSILREISDLGLDALENLGKVKNIENVEEMYDEEDTAPPPQENKPHSEQPTPPSNGTVETKVKRFFKGVKKK